MILFYDIILWYWQILLSMKKTNILLPLASCLFQFRPDICLLPTTDFLLPTTNYRLPTTDYLLPTTDYQLPTTDYQLPTPYLLLIPVTFPSHSLKYILLIQE